MADNQVPITATEISSDDPNYPIQTILKEESLDKMAMLSSYEKPKVAITTEPAATTLTSPSIKAERIEIVKAAMLPTYELQARLEPYGEKDQVKKTQDNILKNLFGF